MKRIFALAWVAMLLGASLAHAGNVGVGAFGGWSVPVVQEDQGNGSIYGFRFPLTFTPLVAVEPYFSSSALGDKTVSSGGFEYTREGSDVTTWGANVTFSMGGPMRFFPYAGIGTVNYQRTGQDENYTSYQFGLGLGFTPAPKVSLDVRAELQMAAKDQVSRKTGNFTVGASYALFSLN